MQGLEHTDELVSQAILESSPLAFNPARHEQDLFMLHVHDLNLADPIRKFEHFRFGERGSGEPAFILLPYDWRIQALFDCGPDREIGGELVALDLDIGTVTNAKLLDLVE
jgi:hypothetical protein